MMKFAILCSLLGSAVAFRDQSIAVKGKLVCGLKPAAQVRVRLWDEGGSDLDDLLDQGYTDANGLFNLKGGAAELTTMHPILKVFHTCDQELKPGFRMIRFELPASYITNGKVPEKTLDIGTLNLETIFAKEEKVEKNYFR